MSDSDFSDAGEDIETESDIYVEPPPKVNKNGVKVRGVDKSWIETHRFSNASDFKTSEIANKLETEFSQRKNREYEYADVLEYECKFKRRVGFLPCPWKMKVLIFFANGLMDFLKFTF